MPNDNNSLAHNMELQISHSICAEVQKTNLLRRTQSGSRKDTERAVRVEGDKDNRSRDMPGPCAYAGGNPAEAVGFQLYGVPERKKLAADP